MHQYDVVLMGSFHFNSKKIYLLENFPPRKYTVHLFLPPYSRHVIFFPAMLFLPIANTALTICHPFPIFRPILRGYPKVLTLFGLF